MLRIISDMDEVEMRLLGIVHCENGTCKMEPRLKWDLIKESIKMGISERRAREAISYLERKGYFNPELLSIDEYVLTEKGTKYFEQLVANYVKKQEAEKSSI